VIVFIAHVEGQRGELTAEESWHCSKVLRKKSGDSVNLIDGAGNFYEAILDLVSDRKCTVKITRGPVHQEVSSYYLHLAIAPTKQIDRIEWMVEKAVEIGLQEISFFTSKNSERTVLKLDRIKKIVESAVKQSLQARLPIVNDLTSFKELFTKIEVDQKFIAHCYDAPKKHIRSITFNTTSSLVIIGPEGDFTLEEIAFATQHNCQAISLGTNRLRSETAGLYVCQAAALLAT